MPVGTLSLGSEVKAAAAIVGILDAELEVTVERMVVNVFEGVVEEDSDVGEDEEVADEDEVSGSRAATGVGNAKALVGGIVGLAKGMVT